MITGKKDFWEWNAQKNDNSALTENVFQVLFPMGEDGLKLSVYSQKS